jgi:hypothetical protein
VDGIVGLGVGLFESRAEGRVVGDNVTFVGLIVGRPDGRVVGDNVAPLTVGFGEPDVVGLTDE